MVWETAVDLLDIMIPNEFLFGGKSNADIFHEEDTNNIDNDIKTCLLDNDKMNRKD